MPEVTCTKCGKVCASLGGWKSHMSRMHGGYDEEDLQAVAGIGGGGEGNVKQRMEAFAQTMPGGEGGTSPQGSATGVDTSSPPAPASMPVERRVRATPKKLKKILGGIPAEILRQTGIEMDSEDIEALDEAGEFLSDVFGFEFVVPESKVTVQSRWWSIVWVAGVAGLVYVKHRFPEVFKYVFRTLKKKDETDADDNWGNVPDDTMRDSE